jgi:LmbE family N-acetylglucosaminyl deacetylase
MPHPRLSRREALGLSAKLAALAAAARSLPGNVQGAEGTGRKLRILCIGGHPDDPESGCAGTLSRYAQEGHSVTVLYLTRGERGIAGKTLEEAAAIRTRECEAACRIMGATPKFFGQIDGATEVTKTHVEAMAKVLREENADVIFTHWPVDTHMDHQVASFLAIRAWMAAREKAHLYFFEVDTGAQTEGFRPDTWVDVTAVLEKKRGALFAHASQNPEGIWRDYHEVITKWRGREAGVTAAEAFAHVSRGAGNSQLPGL